MVLGRATSQGHLGRWLDHATRRPLSSLGRGDLVAVTHAVRDAAGRAGMGEVRAALALHLETAAQGPTTLINDGLVQSLHGLQANLGMQASLADTFSPSEQLAITNAAMRLEGVIAGTHHVPTKCVVLGDIHGDWNIVRNIVAHELPDGDGTVLSVGDLETYDDIPTHAPFVFIHGNHDKATTLSLMMERRRSAALAPYPLTAGETLMLHGGLTVRGLPGTFSGKHTHSETSARQFPYYSAANIAAAATTSLPCDIFLSHEAPGNVGFTRRNHDLGRPEITNIIRALQPKIAFFGHHHWEYFSMMGDTAVVGLARPGFSYITLETTSDGTIQIARHNTVKIAANVFRYPWDTDAQNDGAHATTILHSLHMHSSDSKMKAIENEIHTQYQERALETLTAHFAARMPDATEDGRRIAAHSYAGLLLNSVLPFAAHYLLAGRSSATTTAELQLIKQRLLRELLAADGEPDAATDLTHTFETLIAIANTHGPS